jgi:hypothetical protein
VSPVKYELGFYIPEDTILHFVFGSLPNCSRIERDCHQLLGLQAADGSDEVKDLTFQIGEILSALPPIILP